jgi:hypothetical protein
MVTAVSYHDLLRNEDRLRNLPLAALLRGRQQMAVQSWRPMDTRSSAGLKALGLPYPVLTDACYLQREENPETKEMGWRHDSLVFDSNTSWICISRLSDVPRGPPTAAGRPTSTGDSSVFNSKLS